MNIWARGFIRTTSNNIEEPSNNASPKRRYECNLL